MKHCFSYYNTCALITGASSGLGAEFARQLAPHARDLILVARRGERLKILSQELIKLNPALRVHVKVIDVGNSAEREKLAVWTIEQKLQLNLLINNAGLGDLSEFGDASWNRLEAILNVNITALTHLTHLLLPLLRQHRPSAILNVGSIAGYLPLTGYLVYAASKAYVRSFSEALRIEEACHNVTVSLLSPGPVPTEFFDVASRQGEKISVTERAAAPLITSKEKVVKTALQGVLSHQPEIIPNFLLRVVFTISLKLPFFLQRKILFKKRKNEIATRKAGNFTISSFF
ncbi:MAG: SDR family NAD(P)-dependent oxidoreductase [Chthoniobacterales bacterium]